MKICRTCVIISLEGMLMKLLVLCDNNTFIDSYLIGEPALSFYIENGKDKILFDLGYSNVFKFNAEKRNINLEKINKIVLSSWT